MRRVVWCLVALVCAACEEAKTSAVIELRSDFDDAIGDVAVEIRDARDARVLSQASFARASGTSFQMPFSFGVQPQASGDAFVVKATAHASGREPVTSKLRVSYERGRTVRRTLFLHAACAGVSCDDGESCDALAGGCAAVSGVAAADGGGRERAGGSDVHAAGDGGAAAKTRSRDDGESAADASGSAADGGDATLGAGGGAGASAANGGGRMPADGAAVAGGAATLGGQAASGGTAADRGGETASDGAVTGAGGHTAAGDAAASGGGDTASGGAAAGGGGHAASGGSAADGGTSTPRAGAGAPPDVGQGTLTEKQWASVMHAGRNYTVHSNVYGPGALTLEYTGASFTVTSESGSASGGVAAPSVFIGRVYDEGVPDRVLPARVSDLQRVSIAFTHNAASVDGAYRVVAGAWLSTSASGDTGFASGGTLEVWPYAKPGQTPNGTLQARALSFAGVPGSWDVWVGTYADRPAVVYVRTEALSSVELDLKPFLDDAAQRPNAIDAAWYVTSVSAGFDIYGGGRGLQLELANISAE